MYITVEKSIVILSLNGGIYKTQYFSKKIRETDKV
ncbi:hypothetical protein C8C84_2731 [Flavobacterium sp. 102]|nr:hypothetical protein C8C84_2731 [Flavobacterium sp. 102]